MPAALSKKGLHHRFLPVSFENFKKTFFVEHLWATASGLIILPIFTFPHQIKLGFLRWFG